MIQKLLVFSHGKESGPAGSKILALMAVARRHGAEVISVDYRQNPAGVHHDQNAPGESERRVAQLLATPLPLHERLILVGSSMGVYVSTVASAPLHAAGLFLLAPAFGLPGYAVQNPSPGAAHTLIVHGWGDDVVPVDHSIAFARQHRCHLHLLNGDHRLNGVLDQLELIFGS
ncbi:MAG: alpha/beta hydrolase [Rhodoferax sp.]|nr:alpha/beta hydrolase [Rhodoferax sp.]